MTRPVRFKKRDRKRIEERLRGSAVGVVVLTPEESAKLKAALNLGERGGSK